MSKKVILLSFDIEEFDLPLEYGINISEKMQFELSFIGLKKIINLLDKKEIKATFFVTASFAKRYPVIIKEISKKHEIASHSLHHKVKNNNEDEIKKSKEIIEEIIGKKINGFRSPRLQKVNVGFLNKIGFKYDSSVCPSYLPSRYNNYFENREIAKNKNVANVPISTMPIIHLPLYWIFFKNFGLIYSKIITNLCIKNPGFVNLFFHPWEFNDLSNFKIPFYIKRKSGNKTMKIINSYIDWCERKGYSFLTFTDYLNSL